MQDISESSLLLLVRHGLVLTWLLSTPLLCLLYLKIPPSPDQMQFDYMAWLATQGLPYYSGTFDMNWPGGMILQELGVRLFGPRPWSWHLTDFLLLQVITLSIVLFLHRAHSAIAAFLVLPLYPALYVTSGYWMAGQRDIIAVGLLICACTAMLADPQHERRSFLIAGMLTGCAVLIRPTYLSVLVGFIVLEAAPRSWIGVPREQRLPARIRLVSSGFLLPVGLVAGAGLWIGSLDDWYQQSLVFTLSAYAGEAPLDPIQTLIDTFFRSWHWLTLLATIGLLLWIRRDGKVSYPVMLVIGLAAAIALSYFVQNKGFGYHLGGALPILALLTVVAVDQLSRLSRLVHPGLGRTALQLGLTLCILLILAGTSKKLLNEAHYLSDIRAHGMRPVTPSGMTSEEQDQMVAMIQAETDPEDRIVQYGTRYQIPYLAQRKPSYRFITPAIDIITPDFSLYSSWLDEVVKGLNRTEPRFVLIDREAAEKSADGLRAREAGKPVLSILIEYVSSDYRIVMEGDYGFLLRRITP